MNLWQGQRVRLRAMTVGDADFLHPLRQDTEMQMLFSQVRVPESLEACRRFLEELIAKKPEDDSVPLVIETLAGVPAGTIFAHHCDARLGRLFYGVLIHPEHRRKGYASEAVVLLLRYFFDFLRYQKADAKVYGYNRVSQVFHERLAFVLEGRFRRELFLGGEYYDVLQFGMTREEFHARHGKSTWRTLQSTSDPATNR